MAEIIVVESNVNNSSFRPKTITLSITIQSREEQEGMVKLYNRLKKGSAVLSKRFTSSSKPKDSIGEYYGDDIIFEIASKMTYELLKK